MNEQQEKSTETPTGAASELSAGLGVKQLDIVTRMRNSIRWLKRDGFLTTAGYTEEAVDEIERLRAALRLYVDAGFGNSTDFRKQGEAYDAAIEVLK